MGKGARTRRRQAATTTPARWGPLFHGGVPGKQVGELLVPADRLGAQYTYAFAEATTYDPTWVYATTDVGVADAYASRYLTADGHVIPGDVYEIEPGGRVEVDPDYDMFAGAFLRCPQARITAVVARAVVLTAAELGQRERRYQVWDHPDRHVWDEHGRINPSDQMLANGITREWTTLLRPWLRLPDINPYGQLVAAATSPNPWVAFLQLVPSLDQDHRIEPRTASAVYRCATCGGCTDDTFTAATHQLGETAVKLIARIHEIELPTVIQQLAIHAHDREPQRWAWLPD